jgi:hypothetical protein
VDSAQVVLLLIEIGSCVDARFRCRNGTLHHKLSHKKAQKAQNYFSRKGAKAQSAAAFLEGFLCVFAPLRERSSLGIEVAKESSACGTVR